MWLREQGNRVLVTFAYCQASCPVCRLFTVLTFYRTRPRPRSSRFTLVHGECVGPGNHHNVRECQRMSGTFVFLPRSCVEKNPCGVLEGGALPRRPAPPKARLPWLREVYFQDKVPIASEFDGRILRWAGGWQVRDPSRGIFRPMGAIGMQASLGPKLLLAGRLDG